MLRIDKNLILVDCEFGSFFINDIGAQVQDPDFKTCEVDPGHRAWFRYTFLKKKRIHSSVLVKKVKIIIERIKTVYQV